MSTKDLVIVIVTALLMGILAGVYLSSWQNRAIEAKTSALENKSAYLDGERELMRLRLTQLEARVAQMDVNMGVLVEGETSFTKAVHQYSMDIKEELSVMKLAIATCVGENKFHKAMAAVADLQAELDESVKRTRK